MDSNLQFSIVIIQNIFSCMTGRLPPKIFILPIHFFTIFLAGEIKKILTKNPNPMRSGSDKNTPDVGRYSHTEYLFRSLMIQKMKNES